MVYTSLLVYTNGFNLKEAIPIGSVIIFVQNTIMLMYFFGKRHPETNQRLLVFDNFLILLPTIFAGNMSGYFLFVTFPRMVINISFGLTLCFFIFIVVKE